MRRLLLAGLAATLLGLPVPGAGAAATSFDYTRVKGLSAERYEPAVREKFDIPMRDGVEIHVEVVAPDAPGRFGTILKMSPYHGSGEDRDGVNVMPPGFGSLVSYFVPRGYAVAFADLRGTGLSQGCLDYLGPTDRKDIHDVVEWLARQEWSNGRVGMTGISYPGSTPIVAAAARPPHLTTIVPIAGLPAMYHHQFQNGVPYFAQWAGVAGFYEQYSVSRLVQDPAGMAGYPPACGMPNTAAVNEGEAFTSGARTDWHRARDWTAQAAAAPIPVFLSHGVFDGSVRSAAIDWFHKRRRPGDKLWLGQWRHQDAPREDQWMSALHAWFDRHLQGRRVATGPPVEVFLNDGRVFQAGAWPVPTRTVTYSTTPGGWLSTSGREEEEAMRYVADASGHASEFDTGSLVFDADPVSHDRLLLGFPLLRLRVAVSSPRIHLLGTLYDVDGDTDTVAKIGQATFAIQPELRDGVDRPRPVTPGELMTMTTQGMPLAHVLLPGHHLRLVLASSHPDKVPVFSAGTVVDVTTGGTDPTRVALPVLERPRLLDDVLEPGD